MCVSSATLFGKEIHLLSFPSFDKDGRFAFCYNYFENDFWEDACLTADGGFWSNKVGGRFASIILAMYTLQEFYDEGFCLPDIDGRIGACGAHCSTSAAMISVDTDADGTVYSLYRSIRNKR